MGIQYASYSIDSNSNLFFWGNNSYGNLGDNSTINKSYPVLVGTNFSEIMSDSNSVFAKKTDGTIWCWGANNFGKLGLNDKTHRSSPVLFSSSGIWSKIDSGYSHVLAIKNDGSLWSWGRNDSGCLGDNTSTHRSSPILVSSSTDWKEISCEAFASYALKQDGTLWCWGTAYNGAWGNGSASATVSPGRSSMLQIGTSTTWSKISALEGGGCAAVKTDGTIWSWGANTNGISGNSNSFTSSPVQALGSNYESIKAGRICLIAKKNNNTFWQTGLIFNGSSSNQIAVSSPIQISGTNYSNFSFSNLNVVFNNSFIGLVTVPALPTATIVPASPTPTPTPTATPTPQNGLWVWGNNNNGCLGIGDTVNRSSPVQLGSNTEWTDSRIVSISSSDGDHTIVCKKDGTIWGWGNNTYGQLGSGTLTHRSSPAQIGTSSDWANAVAGAFFTVAVKTDGSLYTWGRNSNGYLGNNQGGTDQPYPYRIGLQNTWSKDVNHLDSARHTAAIKTNGTLWAWGVNSFGQIGNNASTTVSSPVQIGSGTDWAYVAVSGSDNATAYAHTIGIKTNGTMFAWGVNNLGQIGDNTTVNRSSPVQIPGTTWKYAKPFYGGTVAIKTNGTMWSWGEFTYGCLGTNSTANRSSPVQIGIGTWNALTKDNFDAKFRSVIATSSTEFYKMQTWGEGTDGVQDNSSTTQNSAPYPLIPEKNWTAVSQSYSRVFAMSSDNSSFAGLILDLDPRNYTSGNTWNDATTFANNATVGDNATVKNQFYNNYSGAFYPTTYEFNPSVFPGIYSPAYSTISTSKSFLHNSGTSTVSYEIWFRADLQFFDFSLMGWSNFTSITLKGETGILQASGGGVTVSTSSSVCDYKWHQACVVMTSSSLRLYFDGTLIGSAAPTSFNSGFGPWSLNSPLVNVSGVPIAKARAWYNIALSDSDILTSYNSWKSTAAYPSHSNLTKFAYTGSMQTWTCPAGVTEVLAFTHGGSGGWPKFNSNYVGATPGYGGTCSALISVTPGTTYNIVVGGSPDAGGNFGYGGAGTSYLTGGYAYISGAGGGLSGIFNGTPSFGTSLITAGGGGGSMLTLVTQAGSTLTPGLGITGGNGGLMTSRGFYGVFYGINGSPCDGVFNSAQNGGVVNGNSPSSGVYAGSVPMVGSTGVQGANGTTGTTKLISSSSSNFGTSGGGGGVNGGSSGSVYCSTYPGPGTTNSSSYMVRGAGGGASYIPTTAKLQTHFFYRIMATTTPGTASHGFVTIVY